jgi:hypothetical protein
MRPQFLKVRLPPLITQYALKPAPIDSKSLLAILFPCCRGHASLLWSAVTRPAEKFLVAESVIEKGINPRGITAGKSFVRVCIAMLRSFRNPA